MVFVCVRDHKGENYERLVRANVCVCYRDHKGDVCVCVCVCMQHGMAWHVQEPVTPAKWSLWFLE